jgi:hypothetical protein
MESQLSTVARQHLDRFCRQCLQIILELAYPVAEQLRQDAFQQALYDRLFKDGALEYAPPQHYQLRVLKELTKRIEESIQDWEEEVSGSFIVEVYRTICRFSTYGTRRRSLFTFSIWFFFGLGGTTYKENWLRNEI